MPPLPWTSFSPPFSNARLKKIVADLTLDKEMLQDVIKRKL